MKMMGKLLVHLNNVPNSNFVEIFSYEPKYRSSGTEQQDDDENEEESEEEIEEAEEIVKKPDIQMNARRWRWEVLDD